MLNFCRLQAGNLAGRFRETDPARARLVLVAALLISLLSSLIFSTRLGVQGLDAAYDLLLRAKAHLETRTGSTDEPADSPVAIVAIDDHTLSYAPLAVPELFQPHYYLEIIKAMDRAQAKAVVLTRMLPRFRDALSPTEDVREWFETVPKLQNTPVLSGLIWRPKRIVLPATDYLLSMHHQSFGFLNLKRDEDAEVRRLPVRWPGCNGTFGCLSLSFLAARALDPDLAEPDDDVYIDFDPQPDAVPVISFLDVYRRAMEYEANADFFSRFEGKLVLIGEINFLNRGAWPTPFSEETGHGDTTVEIIAQSVLTLLNGNYLRTLSRPGELVYLFLMALVSLLPLMLSQRCGPYPGLWLPMALLPCFAILAGAAFLRHLYLPLLPGLSVFIMAQVFALLVRSLESRQAARTTLTALSLYVSPKLAEQIVAHPEYLSRSGQRQEMTAFFSDLVGFTSLAEHRSPEDLVADLNRYFEAMEPIISASGGILDKFGGDAIMAFWGSPLLPQPDHARAGCLAALDQQEALARLNARLLGEGRPPLSALMGLTSGLMVVGNIGAEKRLNYTVMGDAVNLASRLVAVNKIYQTHIIVSEQTAREAGEDLEMRALDRITVPGRGESLSIYEVMGRRGELDDELKRGRDLFETGLKFYFERNFQKALGLFEATLAHIQGDGPAELMSSRCREFLLKAPPDDWLGVTCVLVK